MQRIIFALLVCLLVLTGCRNGEPPPSEVESSVWESEPESAVLPEPAESAWFEEPESPDPEWELESSIEIPLAQPENSVPRRPELQETSEPAASSSAADTRQQFDTAKIERELLRLINAERAAVGAESLGEQEDMQFAARIRSSEVLASLSHTRPDGASYYTAFDEAGFVYAGRVHGENIATLHFSPGLHDEYSAAAEMFRSLKNSPGHYQNMVNGDYLHAGVGAYASFDGELWNIGSVQLFASGRAN